MYLVCETGLTNQCFTKTWFISFKLKAVLSSCNVMVQCLPWSADSIFNVSRGFCCDPLAYIYGHVTESSVDNHSLAWSERRYRFLSLTFILT